MAVTEQLEIEDHYRAMRRQLRLTQEQFAHKLGVTYGDCLMPEISRFLGIIITIYYNDHPPPHFHVRYNQQKALVNIEELSVIEGKLSPRILGLVIEWAAIHKPELSENWQKARLNIPLDSIAPLE